jgi:hypothetical protein
VVHCLACHPLIHLRPEYFLARIPANFVHQFRT